MTRTGGIAAGIAGVAAWAMQQAGRQGFVGVAEPAAEKPIPATLPRKDAVLVLGASGRVGRRVVARVSGPAHNTLLSHCPTW